MADEISIRDYIDLRIKNVEDKINSLSIYLTQHFELNEKAIKKAEEDMTVRLEGMNEFRSQINSERSNYVTRELLEKDKETTDTRLKLLEKANAFSAGKMWVVMAGFAIVPTIISLIAIFRE